ncbi:MAG: OmpA family protein [Rickettsiales bacterium]|jgi:chemotaxis protein MotB|nr:OmpA family protein [Rickettsiales bacterium]
MREETDIQNLWPSFVDLMSNMFILMLFLVIAFVLTNFISVAAFPTGSASVDRRIAELEHEAEEKSRLNQALISHLKSVKKDAGRIIEAEKNEVKLSASNARVAELNAIVFEMQDDIIRKDNQIREHRRAAEGMSEQIDRLTNEMRKLNGVFETTDKYIKWQKVQIVELGRKLNRALANKTAELVKVRSEFFESLVGAVESNPNFAITGDRFMMPSEVFFESASANVGEKGETELRKIASAILDAMKSFPSETGWIVRVDGHTDDTPLPKGAPFESNWELSQARALAVVKFLIAQGVPPERLAATGFGEFHPIDRKSRAKNRRIEFKLTER